MACELAITEQFFAPPLFLGVLLLQGGGGEVGELVMYHKVKILYFSGWTFFLPLSLSCLSLSLRRIKIIKEYNIKNIVLNGLVIL